MTNGFGWTPNGAATVADASLTLVAGGGQVGSFFFNSPVYVGGFRASFIYQDIGGGGADGFTFCLQNDPRATAAIGGGGGGLGVSGIAPGAELTFNIYDNNTPGISFGTNGANGSPFNPTTINIASGDAIAVALVYLDGVLNVTLTDTNTSTTYSTNITANLPAIVGSQQAYIGFTGASGGIASTQSITGFSYVPLVALAATTSGQNIVLTWPTGTGGYSLQATPDLSSPAWQNVDAAVSQVAGKNQVSILATTAGKFYRLVVQLPPE